MRWSRSGMPVTSTAEARDEGDARAAEDDQRQEVADQDAHAPPAGRLVEQQRQRDQQPDHERREPPGPVGEVGGEYQPEHTRDDDIDTADDRAEHQLERVTLLWR